MQGFSLARLLFWDGTCLGGGSIVNVAFLAFDSVTNQLGSTHIFLWAVFAFAHITSTVLRLGKNVIITS
jgi:hypothetical protein